MSEEPNTEGPDERDDHVEGATRCGFVALVGAPNAGKSTLVNKLVGVKVSIVSHKVQTTRALIRGLVIQDGAQIVFVDTPGIFAPKRRLDRAMVSTAWGGATDADVIALLIDVRKGLDDDNLAILDKLADAPRRKILILNKIDMIARDQLLALAQDAAARVSFDRIFMISAKTGDGVKDIPAYLADEMPLGPWLYPADDVSDLPMRALAAEITREKLFARLHDELPYASTVETEKWEVRPDGSARVEQTIFVERESQKRIVIGANGQTIKSISMDARKEISEIAETTVHLFLFVKVRENWGDDPERYREMGLQFPRN
ncbi:GTPase Era [Methylopila sp. M107]|uniref:GTPase Era n=1 Tax=Methylopila sp. M107 TaxID=1101190 RepID=UPI00036F39C5|nr:GTPase Era [Methylopila sp. M107]